MAATVRAATAPTAVLAQTSPAGTLIGDLVICITFGRGAAGVPTHTCQTGSNFVEIRTHAHDDGSTDGRLSVAYKIATQNGAQSYQAYTSSLAAGSDWTAIVVLTVGTWENTALLIGDQQNSATLTTNAVPNPPAITTPQTQCLVLQIAAWHFASSLANTAVAPSGYALVTEVAGAALADLAVAQLTKAAAGTEDAAVWGDNQAPSGTVAMVIAFRPRAVTLAADLGTFAITGNDATLTGPPASITADVASFAIAGSTTGLTTQRLMAAVAASFAIAGSDADLTYTPSTGSTLDVDAGAFAITGSATGLTVQRRADAEPGTFVVSTSTTDLRAAHAVSAAAVAFAVSGVGVAFATGKSLGVDAGSFVLSGSATGLQTARTFATDVGTFALTGSDAGLAASRGLTSAAGTFALAGGDVSFASGKGVTVDSGAFNLTASDVGLVATRVLGAALGEFGIGASSAELPRGYLTVPNVGSFAIAGVDVGLDVGGPSGEFTLDAGVAAFAIVGADAGIVPPRRTFPAALPCAEVTVEEVRRRR